MMTMNSTHSKMLVKSFTNDYLSSMMVLKVTESMPVWQIKQRYDKIRDLRLGLDVEDQTDVKVA